MIDLAELEELWQGRHEEEDSWTFYAVSDVHAERPANMAWLWRIPHCPQSVLLLAGDIAVTLVLPLPPPQFTLVTLRVHHHPSY